MFARLPVTIAKHPAAGLGPETNRTWKLSENVPKRRSRAAIQDGLSSSCTLSGGVEGSEVIPKSPFQFYISFDINT